MTRVTLSEEQARAGLLFADYYWKPGDLTFSIADTGSAWSGYAAGEEPFDGYSALNGQQANRFRDAVQLWDRLIAPSIVEVSGNAGNIRVGFTAVEDQELWGYTYSPPFQGGAGPAKAGDIWIDEDLRSTDFAAGEYDFGSLIHEVGHALGLKHSFESPLLPAEYDDVRFTVMAYDQPRDTFFYKFEQAPSGGLSSVGVLVSPSTPMVADIAAVQARYGADPTTGAGGDTYQYTTSSAASFSAIYDAGGYDYIDTSSIMGRPSIIDLTPGAYSSIDIYPVEQQIEDAVARFGEQYRSFITEQYNDNDAFTWAYNVGIAQNTIIEGALGGSGDDRLIGNDADNFLSGNTGNDVLLGGPGDDRIESQAGSDVVDGGPGVDTLLIRSLNNVTVSLRSDGAILFFDKDGSETSALGIEHLDFSGRPLSTRDLYTIDAHYRDWGGRAASSAELTYWADKITDHWTPTDSIRAVIIADPLGESHTAGRITALYRDYGGRAATAGEIDVWQGLYSAGGATYNSTRLAILNDSLGRSYSAQRITELYQDYGGRAPTANEIAVWRGAWAAGANDDTTRLAILADPLGRNHTTQQISALYQEFGGRAPTADEMAVWQGLYAGGATPDTTRIAILNDPLGRAYTAARITELYQDYGGRAPTTAEIGTWQSLYAGGADYDATRVAIMADPLGRTYTRGEINDLYLGFGGRGASAGEVAYWQGQLSDGLTLASVRAAIIADPLGRDGVIETYTTLFGRAPSSQEIAYWRDAFQRGADHTDLRQAILAEPAGQAHLRSVVDASYRDIMNRTPTTAEQTAWNGLFATRPIDRDTLLLTLAVDGGSGAARLSGTPADDMLQLPVQLTTTVIDNFNSARDAISLRNTDAAATNPGFRYAWDLDGNPSVLSSPSVPSSGDTELIVVRNVSTFATDDFLL